ncbi:MAG: hypothetical protein IJ174_05515 [Clostridia bacterium]|nr:hypothetical protein [Clostridia bacterium]
MIVTTLTLNHMSSAIKKETESRISQMLHLAGVNLDARFQSISTMTERMYWH